MMGLAELEACYKGEQGKQLDAQARDETNSLKPGHTYVPWVGLVQHARDIVSAEIPAFV